MTHRPNILFLMSDEHRADVAGYEGDQVIRTPNLDRLAQQGVVFEHAYTPSPVCIPARQSMMAGQLPRTCGCEVYGEDLQPGYMTFARRLSQYGYATVACGKLHHCGPDQMQGWTRRIGNEMEVTTRYIEDKDEEEIARYKLPSQKWSDAKEIKRAGIGRGRWVANDEYTLQGALNFIEEYFADPFWDREQGHRPLLLKASFLQPHYPFTAEESRFNYYLNRVNPMLDQVVSTHPILSQRQVRPGVDASEREIRRAVAAYYSMVEAVDSYIGAIMAALQHIGQDLDDWIIIYTSDHGEMLGEHGIWEKQKFYEASVRVPLVISWPKRFNGGRRVTQNVSLCDLFATLCDFTGIPVPDNLESRSLVQLLSNDAANWPDLSVSQFARTHLMIKKGQLKYQYYGEKAPEVLFDHSADPTETIDFLADPQYATELAWLREYRDRLGFKPLS